MTTIIVATILIISISLILTGLRMSMNEVESKRDSQDRLNERILSSLPDNFRLDQ